MYPFNSVTKPVSTITEKLHADVLPGLSVKMYATCVSPISKLSPGSWEATVWKGTSSVAVGSVQVTVVSVVPNSVVALISTGHPVTTGGSVSVTIIKTLLLIY